MDLPQNKLKVDIGNWPFLYCCQFECEVVLFLSGKQVADIHVHLQHQDSVLRSFLAAKFAVAHDEEDQVK